MKKYLLILLLLCGCQESSSSPTTITAVCESGTADVSLCMVERDGRLAVAAWSISLKNPPEEAGVYNIEVTFFDENGKALARDDRDFKLKASDTSLCNSIFDMSFDDFTRVKSSSISVSPRK